MSEQFRERGYIVASVDNAPDSNATIKMNILDLDPQKLSFVPDFIWASLPCETFSRMSGSHHRSEVNDRTRVSKKAMEHNDLFLKMVGIMEWAKSLHPHLIVVIENPVGKLLVRFLSSATAVIVLSRTFSHLRIFFMPVPSIRLLW